MAELAYARSFLAALDACPVRIPADHVEDPKKYPTKSPFILPRMPNPIKRPDPTPSSSSTAAATDPAIRPPPPPTSGPSTGSTAIDSSSVSASASSSSSSFPGGAVQVVLRALTRAHFPGLCPDDLQLRPLAAATTAALDVRRAVADRTGIPLDKLRLLHRRKPVADSKALRDLLLVPDEDNNNHHQHHHHHGDKMIKNEQGMPVVEFSVMVMGGAATAVAAAGSAAAAAEREKERARKEAEEVEMEKEKETTMTAAAAAAAEKMDVDDNEEEEARRGKDRHGEEEGGGGGETAVQNEETVGVAQGLSSAGVLETEAFWTDLKGFLQQRIRDEDKAGEAWGVFREAWERGKQ